MKLVSPIYIYILIFIAKFIEVTLATLRGVLNNRGQKKLASFIGFVEIIIWVFVAGNVLNDLANDPMKAVMYCIAFSLGNYIGVTVEEKLALGMVSFEVLVKAKEATKLANILRENGFGVTSINCFGLTEEMYILKSFLKRKQVQRVTKILQNYSPSIIFSISDVKTITGGFIK